MQFSFFGASDIGAHRKHNEDSYRCNPEERLFLVADGMGGQASGEVASKLAVQTTEEFIMRSRTENIAWPIDYRQELTPEQNRLLAAATYANNKIHDLSRQNPSMKGMGTTLVGALIKSDRLAILNIGDSRLYRVRGERIEQITQDHTIVAEQERRGLLSKEEACRHPQKHILMSALGIGAIEDIKVDVYLVKVLRGDLYLICSDGLNDMLSDEEILATIRSDNDQSLEKIGLSLIKRANLSGGYDNITVILVFFY